MRLTASLPRKESADSQGNCDDAPCVVGRVVGGAAAVAVAKASGVVSVAPTSNLVQHLSVVRIDTKESSSED